MSFQLPAVTDAVAKALECVVSDPSGACWNISMKCGDVCLGRMWKRRSAEECIRSATVFDSSVVPGIGIDRYVKRLAGTFRCSDAMFVAALCIVDRLLEYDGGRLPLTKRNVHRLYFCSLLVAVKFNEDQIYNQRHYAKAGGVHLKEVNRLETLIIKTLDWDLRIKSDQFRLYQEMLKEWTGLITHYELAGDWNGGVESLAPSTGSKSSAKSCSRREVASDCESNNDTTSGETSSESDSGTIADPERRRPSTDSAAPSAPAASTAQAVQACQVPPLLVQDPVVWNCRPSVGTWLLIPAPSQWQPATTKVASYACAKC